VGRRNRAFWERTSRAYEQRHRRKLQEHDGMAWGFWRRPERELGLLGNVRGKRILELGCGAARWSKGLARRGGRPVGLDSSAEQLKAAVSVLGREHRKVPLLRANAELLPFKDGSFDLAFCDFGALTFADPTRAVPEASRVLRKGGRLVFAQASPLRFLFEDVARERLSPKLQRGYFELDWLHFPDTSERTFTYAGWVQLFRESGFVVEDLLETHPGPKDRSSYLDQEGERWARRWPIECLWSLRKERAPRTGD
jgi:SAM-dependent methyltransferase